jgi:hypothetical protein
MKKLYVPAKVWTSAAAFLKQFPQTRTAFAVLLAYEYLKNYIEPDEPVHKKKVTPTIVITVPAHNARIRVTGSGGFDLGQSLFSLEGKIETFRDIIRFVLAPDKPLSFRFRYKGNLGEPPRLKHVYEDDTSTEVRYEFSLTGIAMAFILAYYTAPNQDIKNKAIRRLGEYRKGWYHGIWSGPEKRAVKDASWLKNEIINHIGDFINFYARAESEWLNLNEVYGSYGSVDSVPANTIAYTVSGKAPPVPNNVNWKTVDFWSKVWNFSAAKSILNAVAHNMPVKVTTRVESWKNPDKISFEDQKTKYIFKYVYQDFIIEIGKKNNILIKYNRGTRTEEYEKQIKAAWKKLLPMIGIIAIAAVPFAMAAASVVSGASNTGAALTVSSAKTTAVATAVKPVAVTAVAGSSTAGSEIASITAAGAKIAKIVSTGAGLASKVFAAKGDTKTASKLQMVSAVTDSLSEGKNIPANIKTGNFDQLVKTAQPLIASYLEQQKLREIPRTISDYRGDLLFNEPVSLQPYQYPQYRRMQETVNIGGTEIPITYLLLGFIALIIAVK